MNVALLERVATDKFPAGTFSSGRSDLPFNLFQKILFFDSPSSSTTSELLRWQWRSMTGKPLNIAAANFSGITKNGFTVWREGPAPQTLRAPRNLRAHLVRSWDPPPQNMVAHRLQLQSLRADAIGGFGLSPLKEASRRNRLNSVGMIRLSL